METGPELCGDLNFVNLGHKILGNVYSRALVAFNMSQTEVDERDLEYLLALRLMFPRQSSCRVVWGGTGGYENERWARCLLTLNIIHDKVKSNSGKSHLLNLPHL